MMDDSSNIIEATGICKTYAGSDIPAVNGINLSIEKGSFFGLLGPNGAGKTTTMLILGSLLRPDSGDVTIAGISMNDNITRIKSLIGYVPQEVALYLSLTARENLFFFGKMYGLQGGYLNERVTWCLDMADMEELADKRVDSFSGGLKRRLSLAVGLIHCPEILILDEPTVGIDPHSRSFIYESLKKMNSDGITILYTSHYMEEVEHLCNKIAVMNMGSIIASGEIEKLLASQGHGAIEVKTDRQITEVVRERISALSHLGEISFGDRILSLISSVPGSTIPDVIRVLEENGIGIVSLNHGPMNLEQFFMTLTREKPRG